MQTEVRGLQSKIEATDWNSKAQEKEIKEQEEHIHGLKEVAEADREILKMEIKTAPSGKNGIRLKKKHYSQFRRAFAVCARRLGHHN
jgi:hypothetical protein